SPITNMAVNVSYVYIFILCIHNFISNAAVERRFSDFKSCADEECSMLLCRGETFSDYTGPDCRFLPFKKGETIYVYYKLSSQRTNIWAGTSCVVTRLGWYTEDLVKYQVHIMARTVQSQKPSSPMMKLALMRTATRKEDPVLPLLQRISSLELTAPHIEAQVNASQSSSNRHSPTSTDQ
uniref:SH3 domain-containing protein n=1 Tax=Oncorhynchus tshawytscha TaxID=74940 RepID=A0AAZ3P7R0_ONCTS